MIKPLGRNIFIESDKTEEKTKSGLIIQSNTKEEPITGTVKFVGALCESVKVGDKVLFKKYSPDKVKIDEGEYLVCLEDDIMAIINPQ